MSPIEHIHSPTEHSAVMVAWIGLLLRWQDAKKGIIYKICQSSCWLYLVVVGREEIGWWGGGAAEDVFLLLDHLFDRLHLANISVVRFTQVSFFFDV